MIEPEIPSAAPDAIEALERQHEELEALLRDEVDLLREAQDRRFDEIAALTRRIEIPARRFRLEVALSRCRLRRGAEGPPRGLPSPRLQATAIEKSPLFDAARYRQAMEGVLPRRAAAARHYVDLGAFEGVDPGPAFSTRAYYVLNPDVLEAGWPALSHYVLHGAAEDRPIRPAGDDGIEDE